MPDTALAPLAPRSASVPAELRDVATFLDAALAAGTRRAYRAALGCFRAWCAEQGLEALPAQPETVARYLAELARAGRKVATLEQRVAAIRWAHEAAGHESPTAHPGVRGTLSGIRRTLGVAPTRKAPATAERLAAMLAHAPRGTMKGLRDRALLLVGFAGAFRRSELVALEVTDVERTERGLLVSVRRSKGDQEGRGHVRALLLGRNAETCPVRALDAWLKASGITSGPLFRAVNRHGRVAERLTPRAVALVVKAYAELAGLEARDFAGHSLRAGFVTSAAERGARAERIADHTGHRSLGMVRIYTRRADAFEQHAAEGLL